MVRPLAGARARAIGLVLLFAAVGIAGTRLPVVGGEQRERSPQEAEAALLRFDPAGLRSFLTRDAVWVLAADTQTWDESVAPALVDALGPGGGREALDRALARLPSTVSVAGPGISGGRVVVELPDRSRAAAAIWLPPLLSRTRAGEAVLNQKRPNRGAFVAGAELLEGRALNGFSISSLPRAATRGRAPALEPRELPDQGTLVIFGGRGAAGDDADDLRAELRRLVGADELPVGALRGFPDEGSLVEELTAVRLQTDLLELEEDWYRTLSLDPGSWRLNPGSARHPSRALLRVAPMVAAGPDGGGAVLGAVALYTPLFLAPDEAAALAGRGTRPFAEAVHRGELPFLRLGGDLLFYRADVDRWARGEALTPEGKARTAKEAGDRALAAADRSGNRGVARLAAGPLPMRFQPIPESERADLVDSRKKVRARVFDGDVAAWLGRQDAELAGRTALSWVLGPDPGAAQLDRSWVRAAAPRPTPEPAEPTEPSGPTDGPSPSLPPGPAPSPSPGPAPSPTAAPAIASRDPGPAMLAWLDVVDLYLDGACPAGGTGAGVVELSIDGLPETGSAGLRLEWDLTVGGRDVAQDTLELTRGSGTHSIDLEIACGDTAGEGTLDVLVIWADKTLRAEGSTPVAVRSSSGRTFAALRLPAPKKCLTASLELDDGEDFGVATAAGLTPGQIGMAVRAFQEETLRCQPDGGVSGTVVLELGVGCDGVVRSASVQEDLSTDPTGAFARCVAETFGFAEFPAHDGDTVIFEQSLRFE